MTDTRALRPLLVGRYRSPFVRRVAIALTLGGMAFDRVVISPITDPAAVRAYTPIGRVPVLQLPDGERLIESACILDYVLETGTFAHPLLAPAGAARRHTLQICAAMTSALEKAVQAFYEVTKRPKELIHPPYRAQLEEQARAGLDLVEQAARAVPGAVLVGEHLTLADINAAVGWSFLCDFAPALADAGRCPALAAHAARCEQLPAFLACALEPLSA